MKNRFGWGPASFAVSLLALTLSLGGTGYALTAASQHQSAPAALPKWHTLTLQNGWKWGGGGSYLPAFYKDSGGVVHLRGSVCCGSQSQRVFTLPAGDRPGRILFMPIYANGATSAALEIFPKGWAFVFDNSGGSAVTAYASFDGVSFRVP